METENKTPFILESDPAKQQGRLEAAYSDVMDNNRGVSIPNEVLERYRGVNNDPAQKLITAVKDYYNNTLKGKKVEVTVNEGIVEVSFENDGMKKAVGWRMTPEKAATFEYLEKLLENGKYAYSQENTNVGERRYVPYFHYFVNNANIDGVDIPIKIFIRELNLPVGTQKRYYTHIFIENGEGVVPGLRKNTGGDADVGNALSIVPKLPPT